MNAPSQWEMKLQCNVISHWLGALIKWSLLIKKFIVKKKPMILLRFDVMPWKRFPCYERNPPVTVEFPSQRASNVDLWCFFDNSLNKQLTKHFEWLVIWNAMILICYLDVMTWHWNKDTNQAWNSWNTSHSSPVRASFGVSFVNILEKKMNLQ